MNSSARLTLALGSQSLPSDPATDEVLARRGDADSFAVLYQRHLPAVYGYVSGRLASREEAEDLTSDVFRQVWTSRRGYRGDGSFRAWIFSIVRRTLADRYRRQDRATGLQTGEATDIPDGQASPEDHVIQDERARDVRRLLDGLSPQQQEILRLRFAAELSYAEIATVIGKREEAVKKIAYRALETLRGSNTNA
jgi:RNA polymerase sigma-70 factor (ECF subfamily)